MGHRGLTTGLVLIIGLDLRKLRPLACFPPFKMQSISVNSMNKG